MKIVDTQVHLNRWGPAWIGADPDRIIEAAISAMDAVGISAVMIDERAAPDILNDVDPNATRLPNGACRFATPFAERAVAAYPERFGIIGRADWRDPDLAGRLAELRAVPGLVATQLAPTLREEDWNAFVRGDYAPYFAACEQVGLPLFIFLSGRVEALEPYLAQFPRAQVILDQWGFPMPHEPGERGLAHFEKVVALASYRNLALKWCKGSVFISQEPYPHRDLEPYMKMALDRFGAQRILWASDVTQARGRYTWAEALFQIRDSDVLSQEDKELILGGNCRRILGWQA